MRPLPLGLLLFAAPLHAQLGPVAAPVAALPGAGRPVDIAATAARRAAVLERMGDGIAVIPAATMRNLEAVVLQDNDFRQDDYFFYLTGLETPGAWLVLAAHPDRPAETFLALPERTPARERWTGRRLGPGAEAADLSGIAVTLAAADLDSLLDALERRTGGAWYPVLGRAASRRAQFEALGRTPRETRDLLPLLDSLRLVKDDAEMARLRRAIAITVEGHRAAMRAAEPGMYEYQIEAVIEFTFRNLGADRVGFPSIVGSGPNATTLHYDVNRRRTAAGDLIVMDIGAEYGQYSADVTRTIPVSGAFTERQKALYDLVLAAQQAAIDTIRPGVTVRELNAIARGYLREQSGDLCGDRSCDAYFIHGLSHWLGMRVHDVGDYATPLLPGMVLTVEPGIYLPGEAIGIRIEDDVLVTPDGHEVLSAGAPRTTQEIEAVMAGRSRAAASQETP